MCNFVESVHQIFQNVEQNVFFLSFLTFLDVFHNCIVIVSTTENFYSPFNVGPDVSPKYPLYVIIQQKLVLPKQYFFSPNK